MRENEIDILCIQAKINKNVTEIIKIIEIRMKPAPLLHLQKVWLNSNIDSPYSIFLQVRIAAANLHILDLTSIRHGLIWKIGAPISKGRTQRGL